jgi:hypothetical protein
MGALKRHYESQLTALSMEADQQLRGLEMEREEKIEAMQRLQAAMAGKERELAETQSLRQRDVEEHRAAMRQQEGLRLQLQSELSALQLSSELARECGLGDVVYVAAASWAEYNTSEWPYQPPMTLEQQWRRRLCSCCERRIDMQSDHWRRR